MNLDNLTLGEIKQINNLIGRTNNHPYEIGQPYLIRTVTMIQTGRIVEVTDNEIVIEEAAWIADSGRFSDALKTGEFNEIEPFPDGKVIVGRHSIIDAIKVNFKLPRKAK